MTEARPVRAALWIRPENARDIDAIDTVIAEAFERAPYSAPPTSPGGPPGEVDLIHWLRQDESWIPALSLVAEMEGEIVGHVVLTRAYAGRAAALGLGPLSVKPDMQRQGVGARLVRTALTRAEAAGETLIALLGDPAYYRRFGFVPARALGIEPPDEEWGDYFQALRLRDGATFRGRFRYAEPFRRL